MSMHFHKAHAYGNDFLYVKAADVAGAALPSLARDLCERHTGVGADGLIVYEGDARHSRMTVFNADGGRAEVSGNGLRGLAAVLVDASPWDARMVHVESDAGTKILTLIERTGERYVFRAAMGQPSGLDGSARLDAAGEHLQVVVLNMGNPQCVVLGLLPDASRLRRVGEALEKHSRFPDRTNVSFAEVEAPDRVRILIWERGVGPTTSSGTGSCAALVAAAAFGGAARAADVIAPGGAQRVEWREDGVYLTGWAEILCRGEWLRALPAGR